MADNGFKKDEVKVEELEEPKAKASQGLWTEEMNVAADRLVDTVKSLVREATVRRIVVKNKEGRVLLSLPLWLGLGGIAWLPFYSALTIIAALATEHTIMVERVEES